MLADCAHWGKCMAHILGAVYHSFVLFNPSFVAVETLLGWHMHCAFRLALCRAQADDGQGGSLHRWSWCKVFAWQDMVCFALFCQQW